MVDKVKSADQIKQVEDILNSKGGTLALESSSFPELNIASINNTKSKVNVLYNDTVNSLAQVNLGFISAESEIGEINPMIYQQRTRQEEQARYAGAYLIMAANKPKEYVNSRFKQLNGDNVILADTVTAYPNARAGEIANMSFESFDESSVKATLHANVVAAMNIVQQDDFAETFFPIYTVPATDMGFTFEVPVESAWSGMTHKANGQVTTFDRVPILKGIRDSDILNDRSTDLIPIYRAEGDATILNKDQFVDSALVAPHNVVIDGCEVLTAPLKVGKKVDLIGVSTTDKLVERGLLDHTDSIDGTIGLSRIYIKTAAGVISFNVKDSFTSKFRANAEGHYRQEGLQYISQDLFITGDTLLHDRTAPAAAAALKAGNYRVQLDIKLYGTTNLETGETEVTPGTISIIRAWQDDRECAIKDPGLVTALGDLGKELAVIGWDPDARRTNLNIVSLGKRIEQSIYQIQYKPQFHSPISIEKSLVMNNESPTVDSLVRATKIGMSNAAVARLFDIHALLENVKNLNIEFADVRSGYGGPARFSIRPYVQHLTLDARKIVNNVQSVQKTEDIQGALSAVLTYLVGDALQKTSYGDILRNKQYADRPLVAIGTSEKIAPYLMREGDYRLLGNNVDSTIVTTTNKLMDNEIYATFIMSPKDRGNIPNELDFGFTVYCPEFFVNTTTSAGNSTINLLQIYPLYKHCFNLPILIRITLINLDEVVSKEISKYFADPNSSQEPPVNTFGRMPLHNDFPDVNQFSGGDKGGADDGKGKELNPNPNPNPNGSDKNKDTIKNK